MRGASLMHHELFHLLHTNLLHLNKLSATNTFDGESALQYHCTETEVAIAGVKSIALCQLSLICSTLNSCNKCVQSNKMMLVTGDSRTLNSACKLAPQAVLLTPAMKSPEGVNADCY